MNEELLKSLIESNKILNGAIIDYVETDSLMDDEVIVKWEDVQVHIPRNELDLVLVKKSLKTWVGYRRFFIITHYDLESGKIYGSFKKFKQLKRDETLKELKDEGKEIEADITRIFEWGAYLTYNKTTLVLFNNKWSKDYATIQEYMHTGDKIKVKFFTCDDEYIQVEAVDKFKETKITDISFLKPRDVLIGRVRTVKIDRIYVKVADGLDVLCPIPPEEWYNPEPVVGDTVAVRLTQVHPQEIRLRGKIQGKLESKEIEEKAGKLHNITYITREEFVKSCETDADYVYGDIESKSLKNKRK